MRAAEQRADDGRETEDGTEQAGVDQHPDQLVERVIAHAQNSSGCISRHTGWRAATGSSPCCNECGDNECRTVEVDGQVHEAIPQELLVRAGLIAASRMLDPTLPA